MSESPKPLNPEKVAAVVEYVKANPGCTKKAASEAVAKQASYGYRFVQGAIAQGLIACERSLNVIGRPYALYAAEISSSDA
jgi:hypothetical protein